MTNQPIFYTGKGDDGTTTIYGKPERIPKYHPRPEAYGTIDESQAVIGLLRAGTRQPRVKEILTRVERDLYLMMGQLAVADHVKLPAKPIDHSDVDWVEKVTAEIGQIITMPTEFILPGDTSTGAYANLARTVIRRAERNVAKLYDEEGVSNNAIIPYLNRLSSLLFVLTLFEDQQGGIEQPTISKIA
ncbi:MAG: cob(I)yrinic acid a,c-diamide adenosyltransferase [Anaerolineae bacterium]|nr:cob(I)yrinic acid a,c-diamide adenosyltransferase [Anaerolineae bacterium]MCB9109402.1 cob(I)yrinic acid a,c-diamide adenosyltransferase [Anaerolineales bacterium]